MRNGPAFRIAAILTAVTIIVACAPAEEEAMPDSAAAAAEAPPPAESFTLAAEDGSWSGDITPAGIVFRHKTNDSLMFEYKAPTMNGAIADFESLMMGADTVRFTATLAPSPCTDKAGNQHTHIAQVFLTGDVTLTSKGCASKK